VRIDRAPDPSEKKGAPLAGASAGGAADAPAIGAAAIETLVSEGTGAILRKDFETSARRFGDALAADPALLRARVGYAVSEIALGRDPSALAVVLDGLARSPGSADLNELLGDLRDRDERVEEALASWRRAFELSPCDRLREKILKGEREQTASRDYAFSAAPHFNLRYSGDASRDLAADIAEVLERRYRDLATLFRLAPSQPITVLLYPTKEFHEVAQVGDEILGLYDGKIRVPLGGLDRLDERARGVLAHELTHAFVHAKTHGNCPRWLHEGLAQRVQGRILSLPDRRAIRELLATAPPESWESAGFSYAASLDLTLFLESQRGFDLLVDLLERLGGGADLDTALSATYGADYRTLCRRWAEAVLAGERS
jgi:tetratricopeptide (TPR) repeat protein